MVESYFVNWKTSKTNFSILIPLGLLGSTLHKRNIRECTVVAGCPLNIGTAHRPPLPLAGCPLNIGTAHRPPLPLVALAGCPLNLPLFS